MSTTPDHDHAATRGKPKPDIFDTLATDARTRKMARHLPDTPLSRDHIFAVQGDLQSLIDKEADLTLTKIARGLGKGFSTSYLSQFLALKPEDGASFAGKIEPLVRGINQWIDQYLRSQDTPRPNGFISTAVAERMLTVCSTVLDTHSIGLVYSDAGRGKTMTIEAAKMVFAGSVSVRVRSSTASPSGLAWAIANALSIKPGTLRLTQDRITTMLKDSGRLLMIDEAHQLTHKALEFLRDIHDECHLPIVLFGTHDIQKMTSDHDMYYGQFGRRIAIRYDVTAETRATTGRKPRPLHSVAEIRQMWEGQKLRLTDDGAEMLGRLANTLGLGGLGLVAQVIVIAHKLVKRQAKPVDARVVRRVLQEIHGIELATHMVRTAADAPTAPTPKEAAA